MCAAVLYLFTCQRGVSWQDSGMFQWRVLTGDITGSLGLALAHPLYIAAAQVFTWLPLGSFPFRLNFFSGLGMAVALANLAVSLVLLTGTRWIGFITAAMLALTHTAWWLSTISEVYTWSLAGLSTEVVLLILLLKKPHWRRLAGLAFISGLGLSIHNLALLPLPVYAAVMLYLVKQGRLPAWSMGAAIFFYLSGAGLYIALLLVSMAVSGSPAAALREALFGKYYLEVFATGFTSPYCKINMILGAMNFINVLLPLAVAGWISMKKQLGSVLAAALGAITLIEIVFVVRYPVPDQFTFFLPTLFMIALAAGIGIAMLEGTSLRIKKLVITACVLSILLQPVWYAAAPRLVRASGINVQRSRFLPYRDELRYWLVPWKNAEHSAELFARAALEQAAPDGMILADSTTAYPLLLTQQLCGLFPSVSVRLAGSHLTKGAAAFRSALGTRTLYVVSPHSGYVPAELISDADFIRAEQQPLYQVQWKDRASGIAAADGKKTPGKQ